jgi:hypothetical protein
MQTFKIILQELGRVLQHANIPYMVIGGQAVLLYGEPRLTRDIDITLGVTPDRLPDILSVAKEIGLNVLPESPQAFVEKTMVLPCADEKSGIRVDLIFSFSPYERAAIQRARAVSMDGQDVVFASPEDVLIHKMVAGRPRDLEDVRSIVIRNSELDLEMIRRWLKEFDQAMEGRTLLRDFEEILPN